MTKATELPQALRGSS